MNTPSSDDPTALASLSIGTGFLLTSNVLGHGIFRPPDVRGALLLAAAGLLFLMVAHSHAQKWRERFVRVLQVVLALGVFLVVAALLVSDLREFHYLAKQDWGAIPPPQLIFSATYALASLVALLGISRIALASRQIPN